MARSKVTHKGKLPPAQAFEHLTEVVTTTEAADYAYDQTKVRFTEAGVINKKPAQAMLRKMDNFRHNVYLLRGQNGEPWDGKISAENPFENMQQHLANQEAQVMNDQIQDKSVIMDFAFNNKGEFRRGIIVDGTEMDTDKKQDREKVEAVDNLFNTWLADNQFISDDSAVYESDGNGNIRIDEDGNKVRANGSELRELMNGENGFESYMQDRGFDMTARQQTFPGEEPAVSKKQEQAVQPNAVQEVDIEEVPDYEGVRTPKS